MRTNDKVRKTRFRKLIRESEEDGKFLYDIMGDELGGGEFGDPNTRVLSDVMKENFVRLANKLGVELLHVREDFFDVIPFENNSAYYVDL